MNTQACGLRVLDKRHREECGLFTRSQHTHTQREKVVLQLLDVGGLKTAERGTLCRFNNIRATLVNQCNNLHLIK